MSADAAEGHWVPPMGIIGSAEVHHRAVDGVLRTIKNGSIPSVVQCQTILIKYFVDHEPDDQID